MRLLGTYLIAALAVGCGVGVESAPGTPLTKPDPEECDEPEGPIHPYTLVSEVETLIVGRWKHCSGPAMIVGAKGIEFLANHKYFALVDDGQGTLVRANGFGNEGTWDAYQETSTWVQLNYHPAPNAGNGGAPIFEDGPPRFSIHLSSVTGSSIYVGIDR